MKFTYIKKQLEVDNVWSFYFKPASTYRFVEGQFLEMSLEGDQSDQRGSKRWFSISSSSQDELIRITTRKFDQASSFKKRLFDLQSGQEVECSNPMGDFVLPKNTDVPLIFIAVGIGITPFASMLERYVIQQDRKISLLYQVEDTDQYLFQNELAQINFSSFKVTSDKLNVQEILNFASESNNPTYYLAGPELFMETLTKNLIIHGIDSRQIVTDYFPGYETNS